MNLFDILLLFATASIWILLLVSIVLTISGYIYYLNWSNSPLPQIDEDKLPFVSVMVPAHNEGIVIVRTVEALLNFDYPHDKYEIIVINDNSSDNSAELLFNLKQKYPQRNFTIINTDETNGGKGKSNALNIGFQSAKGDVIAIYDADNTPEAKALYYLVAELENNPEYGAVIGKFRTRNKDVNLLTRFINIETLSFQWMAQAERSQLFQLCTIPGTNFVVRIYMMGYKIKFQPAAVTWEQEPQTFDVWFRQRTRWVKGNVYVIIKNFQLLWNPKAKRIRFDLLYFTSVYFFLLSSLIISDITFILSVAGYITVHAPSFSNTLWLLAVILYVSSVFLTITTEKGEMKISNILVIMLMYVIYTQMWLIVAGKGLYLYIKEQILHIETTQWYKTQRYK